MLDNRTVIETAAKVFEKYDLPDGFFSLTGIHENRVWLRYVFGVWDVPEMEMIVQACNEWKQETANLYFVHHHTEIDGVPVLISGEIPKEAYVND